LEADKGPFKRENRGLIAGLNSTSGKGGSFESRKGILAKREA